MRRTDRKITGSEAKSILRKGKYGVLSTVTDDGHPYGVPLSFCVLDDGIYFHSAVEGQKIDNIKNNKTVSFCVLGATEILADKFSVGYESVIVFGDIEEVFNNQKQKALEELLRKYSPDFFDSGIKHIEKFKNKTRVFKISINQISGKANR